MLPDQFWFIYVQECSVHTYVIVFDRPTKQVFSGHYFCMTFSFLQFWYFYRWNASMTDSIDDKALNKLMKLLFLIQMYFPFSMKIKCVSQFQVNGYRFAQAFTFFFSFYIRCIEAPSNAVFISISVTFSHSITGIFYKSHMRNDESLSNVWCECEFYVWVLRCEHKFIIYLYSVM